MGATTIIILGSINGRKFEAREDVEAIYFRLNREDAFQKLVRVVAEKLALELLAKAAGEGAISA